MRLRRIPLIIPCCCSLLLSAAVSAAESVGRIEVLQWPAWVQRQGQQLVLGPADKLYSDDEITTGSNARLLLRLVDGSAVRFGENTHIKLEDFRLPLPEQDDKPFSGTINLQKGTFRFTTALASSYQRHNIAIKIGTLAAEINGTDIWGKSDYAQDLIVLLDGQIGVSRASDDIVYMNNPLSYFSSPKDGRKLPVAAIAPEIVEEFAVDTELNPDNLGLYENGPYAVYLQSSISSRKIREANALYHEAGYPTQIAKFKVKGTTWHRISVAGFLTEKNAMRFASKMEGVLESKDAWVGLTQN